MKRGKLSWYFCFLIVSTFVNMSLTIFASESRITDGIQAINSGHLLKAKTILSNVSNSTAASALDRAIAYKHLGTVLFRLGESYLSAFDSSMKLFEAELQKNNSSEAQQQYGIMLFQKANCLLADCENKLSHAKLQGVPPIPFPYLTSTTSSILETSLATSSSLFTSVTLI